MTYADEEIIPAGEAKGAIGWHSSAILTLARAIGERILVFGEEFLPLDGTGLLKE